MPKMTAKDSTALSVAQQVYQALQEIGWYWNSDRKEWEYHDPQDADDPTPLIMIRIWADAEIVEDVAGDVIRRVPKNWGKPIKKNGPYPCRPPKQREARMYKEDKINPDQFTHLVALAKQIGAEEIIAFRQTFQTFLGYKLPGDEEYGPGHQINLSGGASMLLVIRFSFADDGPPGIERLK